jgi:hypothetical protein
MKRAEWERNINTRKGKIAVNEHKVKLKKDKRRISKNI